MSRQCVHGPVAEMERWMEKGFECQAEESASVLWELGSYRGFLSSWKYESWFEDSKAGQVSV